MASPLNFKSHQHYHFDDHPLFVFSSLIIFFFTWNPSQCLTFAPFPNAERNLYRRLVEKLGIGADSAKAAIALWLWMESIGYHDLTCRIFSLDDHLLRAATGEAQACASVLQPNSRRPTSNSDLPITAGLVNDPLNLRFFHHNKDVAARGVTHFLHKICDVIFSDNFTKLLDNRTSASTLNPMARPGRNSTERRSMFITFSGGFPLTKEEIQTYFTSKWGNCVEAVIMENTAQGVDPMYGRVVFNSISVIPLILNGNSTAKFVINGKHLRARIFIPKNI